MKKKVRYALGIAGAAPVLATMMPANPVIAATASPAKTAGKEVNVYHIRGPAVDAGCHAGTPASAHDPDGLVVEKFFYKDNHAAGTCIGTVEWHTGGSSAHIRIFAHSAGIHHRTHKVFSHLVHGSHGNYGVHRSYSDRPIQVCFKPVNTAISAACKSVG